MDHLFTIDTYKTVWQSLVQRKSIEQVLEERRMGIVSDEKKKEINLEQVESVNAKDV